MARCDEGYLCEVCGAAVNEIVDSDLYLSFVMGLIREEELTQAPERHIRCNPVQAQFIRHPDFEAVVVDGPFGRAELDADYVGSQDDLVTRAWLRLREVVGLGIPVNEYPLARQ